MTTFRCDSLCLVAAVFLCSCGQSPSGAEHAAENGQTVEIPLRHVDDIKRLVQSADAQAIARELPPILAKIKAANGSIGTELVRAGFAPAPALPEKYGYDGADGTSVGVTVRGEQIEVRVKQEPPQ